MTYGIINCVYVAVYCGIEFTDEVLFLSGSG